MFCPNCGKQVNFDKNFCPHCGKNLRKAANAAKAEERENEEEIGFNPVPYLAAAVAIVLIISVSFVIIKLAGNSKDKSHISAVNSETEPNETNPAEAAQADLSKVSPPTSNAEINDMAGVFAETEKYAYDLVNPFYSYAWPETVNSHDSSYTADFSVENSQAYNTLGLEFWQDRPEISFKRIYNVTVHDVSTSGVYGDTEAEAGSYCICVSYTYELYNSETGKTSSNIELAIDTVKWENRNGENTLLMYKHKWVNDVPLDTTVTIENFECYKNAE